MTPLPPLINLTRVRAPDEWRAIEFISDLHLSLQTPQTFAAFDAYLHHSSADAIFILGDLFEVWVGDDARFHDFEASCVKALALASRHRHVGFMVGNRDFLVGAEMLQACGMQALSDPTLLSAFDQHVLLTHGDALCLADTEYQQFRQQVRNASWKKAFLALSMTERLALARDIRHQSEQRKEQKPDLMDWADVDRTAALAWLQTAGANTLVHGHTHRPKSEVMDDDHLRHVLSDWDMDHSPLRAEILRWTADGFQRRPLNELLRNLPNS